MIFTNRLEQGRGDGNKHLSMEHTKCHKGHHFHVPECSGKFQPSGINHFPATFCHWFSTGFDEKVTKCAFEEGQEMSQV